MTFLNERLLQLVCLVIVVIASTEVGFGQKFFTVEDPIESKYIVVLHDEALGDLNNIAQNLASSYDGTLGFVYGSALVGFSIDIKEANAISLSQEPIVKYVTEDGVVSLSYTQTNAPWNLDRLDQRDRPLSTTYNYNYYGLGTNIYVLDTGINPSHVEFSWSGGGGSRAVLGADFVGGSGLDCNGHGTHVAGTVGGTTYGVAKGARFIIAVRVFGCNRDSPSSVVIAGINWVRANRSARSIANMSFDGGANQAVDDAVRNLIASGTSCVIAAGNGNTDANSRSPARVRQAITVGGTDINDSRVNTNFGTAIDVFAPGENITSAWFTSNTATNVLSGTSMSAPHVVGTIAQYMEANSFYIPTPATLQNVIVGNASWNKVSNPGTGSPNTLLYNAQFVYGEALRPFYRHRNAGLNSYLYVMGWDEVGAGSNGYVLQKVEGYIHTTTDNYTLGPLYRYRNATTNDYYYTMNFSEMGNGANGYVYEKIEGYLRFGSPGLALHRYWNPTTLKHFYTSDFSELGGGANGFIYEGITGYFASQ